MTATVATAGLGFQYRRFGRRTGRMALKGVDLEFEAGRVHALVGANGAGKSTLLRLMAGLLRPTSGQVLVHGHPAGAARVRGRVGFLDESTDHPSRLTVDEGLRLAAALYDLPSQVVAERAGPLCRELALEDLRHRRLSSLSKGQRRRAGLASVLLIQPSVLLLDEPLGGVDPVLCDELRGLLRRTAAAGATVILSSHLLLDVAGASDTVTLLEDGAVVLTGPSEEVLSLPDRWQVEGPVTAEVTADRVVEALRELGVPLDVRRPALTLADLLRRRRGP